LPWIVRGEPLVAVAARPVAERTGRLLLTVHAVDGDPVAFAELANESRPTAWGADAAVGPSD
jgi:hypothetical protein